MAFECGEGLVTGVQKEIALLQGFATSVISDVYGDRLLGTVGLSSYNLGKAHVVGRALTVKVSLGANRSH